MYYEILIIKLDQEYLNINIVVYVSLSSPPFWEHMQKHMVDQISVCGISSY